MDTLITEIQEAMTSDTNGQYHTFQPEIYKCHTYINVFTQDGVGGTMVDILLCHFKFMNSNPDHFFSENLFSNTESVSIMI